MHILHQVAASQRGMTRIFNHTFQVAKFILAVTLIKPWNFISKLQPTFYSYSINYV